MLGIAVSVFFVLAFLGSTAVIAMMFFQYRDRIASIVQNELRADQASTSYPSSAHRRRSAKSALAMTQHRSLQPVPLRAAA